MKSSKNTRTNIMIVFLIAVLIIGYRFIFMTPMDPFEDEQNLLVIEKISMVIKSIETVNFDTSINDNPKFKTLKSISTPLTELPIGRDNPFAQ